MRGKISDWKKMWKVAFCFAKLLLSKIFEIAVHLKVG